MKLLFYSELAGWTGGVERYLAQTAQTLRRAGIGVDGLFARAGAGQDDFLNSFDRTAVGVTPGAFLQQSEANYSAVVIHKFSQAATVQAFRRAGLPVGVFVHDHEFYCPRRAWYTPLHKINCRRSYNWLFCTCCAACRRISTKNELLELTGWGFSKRWAAVKGADKLIVLSKFMRDNLILQGVPPERISLIPPSINVPEQITPQVKSSSCRILGLGQLINGKGVDILLRALTHLRYPDWELDILGSGNAEAGLRAQVRSTLPPERVHFHGYVTAPETFIRNARVVALPWRWQEPFGLVGVEALAEARPIVGFSGTGADEYLQHNVTGLVASERTPEALARELDLVLSDAELAAELGARGRELVIRQYNEAALIAGWRNLLTE